ncbi:hypothetical protein ACJ41O_002082 [Fusarium nematophilum]
MPLPRHHGRQAPRKLTNIAKSRLTRDFSQGPITSLAFFNDAEYLLAGEDTHLVVYELRLGRLVRIASIRVFSAQPIHGIRPLSSGRVLVWGAARVAVLSRLEALLEEGGKIEDVVLKKAIAPDWIYDAAPSPYDGSVVALATAHNEVVCLSVGGDSAPSIGTVVSPSRPILYAVNLKWVDSDSVLVAGGTVFGEILMWRCRIAEAQPEMLAVLNGHEGSIFGVHISEEFPCQDGSALRLLASCSDDRTVRIWDITRQEDGAEDRTSHDFAAPRETGFVSTTPDGEEAPSQDPQGLRPIATIMGHASRIWGVKFVELAAGETLPQSPVTVYSFGEDSTSQRWQLNLDMTLWADASGTSRRRVVSGSLTHSETFAVHDGKHLWSHALTTRGDRTLMATGGADSKISLMTQPASQRSRAAMAPAHELAALDFRDVLTCLPEFRTLRPGRGPEIFSRYAFIGEDRVLATTSLGRLILGVFRPALEWREISTDDQVAEDLKTCYAMRTIGEGIAVMGTISGGLYHFCEAQGVTRIGQVPGKVVNISLLADADGEGPTELLVHLLGTSDTQYFSVDGRTGAVLAAADVRGLDSRFVAMSAARLTEHLIAIGSRHGFLTLLRRKEEGFRPVLDFRFRSRDAITGLVPLPASDEAVAPQYFLATSRDGKYRIYEIEDLGKDVRIHLRHEIAPSFGSIIEGGWFTRDTSPELILYGFKSKNLVVWNETRREEIATVDCGGSHRTFTLAHDPADYNRLRFGFTKASKLFIYSQHRSIHQSLKQGTHGREIRALSSNGRYIATGSEDTTVRIWKYEEQQEGPQGSNGLRCLASMKMHISGLQKLKWVGEDILLTSAGNEEFFMWVVQRLESRYQGLGILCQAVLDDKSPDGDLRIMDFDACKVGGEGGIVITMVLSNSALKTYRYTLRDGFKLLAHMSYTGACLTQVRHLEVDENGLSALTASTDGHLATWEARFDNDKASSHVLVHVAPVHQNSIKSLDLHSRPEGFQVLTGGDDNGLGVTAITPLSNEEGNRSGVADPGDIDAMEAPGSEAANGENSRKLKLLLGGVGFEVWSWQLGVMPE